MGELYCACAYDIDSKVCCIVAADKFHANCYSYSGAVASMHYLLRQKPYHVMWGGEYVALAKELKNFSSKEELLGISTYLNVKSLEINNSEPQEESYYKKVKFIEDNSVTWKKINVWDEAMDYFNWQKTWSVSYEGFLVNHTRKSAVDLADYYAQSRGLIFGRTSSTEMVIDVVPMLTGTGRNTQMALFEGVSADTTEELSGEWCGDLLQIVNECPEGYELINCCFSNVCCGMRYCYSEFGVNPDGYLLKDKDGTLYEAAALTVYGERGPLAAVKVETDAESIKYIPVYAEVSEGSAEAR